jgi:hypothetical protein
MTELQGLLDRLVRMLEGAGVPFMIAGSFASTAHGLPRKNREFSRTEFSRRAEVPLLGVPVFIASPEDTVVAKLEWSRSSGGSERQRRDVAGIVATMGEELDRAYVERWVHELELEDEWDQAQKTRV